MIYKTKRDKRPGFLYEKISDKFGHNIRLGSTNGIKVNGEVKSDLGLQNFTHFGVKTWNKLPPLIRQAPNVQNFKKELKIWVKNSVPL